MWNKMMRKIAGFFLNKKSVYTTGFQGTTKKQCQLCLKKKKRDDINNQKCIIEYIIMFILGLDQ